MWGLVLLIKTKQPATKKLQQNQILEKPSRCRDQPSDQRNKRSSMFMNPLCCKDVLVKSFLHITNSIIVLIVHWIPGWIFGDKDCGFYLLELKTTQTGEFKSFWRKLQFEVFHLASSR